MARVRSRFSPWFTALFVATASTACAVPQRAPRVAEKTSAPTAAMPPAPVAIAEESSLPNENWAVSYERRCLGSITTPAVSPDGKSLSFCEALYDAPTGIFQKRLPIGVRVFVSSSDVYRDDYAGSGSILSVTTDSVRASVDSSLSDDVATSPDGERILTQESRSPPTGFLGDDSVLTLRDATSLKVVSQATFKGGSTAAVGFLADGTPLTFTQEACKTIRIGPESTQTKCPDAALYALRGTKLVHGASIFDAARAVFFGADGHRAALIDAEGLAHVVDPSNGNVVMDVPAPAIDDAEQMIALSTDGDHVAVSSANDLVIFERRGTKFVAAYKGPAWPGDLPPTSLQFSPNGRALYVANGFFMQVVSVDPPAHRPIAPEIAIEPPKGFKLSNEERVADGSPGGTISTIGKWDSLRGPSFTLYREDAGEMSPTLDADAWGKAVVARFVGGSVDDPPSGWKGYHARTWKTEAGRNIEFETHFTSGCDPVDVYYRFAEHGGFLYRGELAVPMFNRPKRKTLNHLFEAFFDKPLGAADHDILRVADLPKPPDGPC